MQTEASEGRVDRAQLLIASPAHALFNAFSTAEALMAWLPPGDMSGRALEYDFRVGGRYRIELTYSADGDAGSGKTTSRSDITAGRFVSIEPAKSVVQTVGFESNDPRFAGEMLMTWTFESVGSKTLVTVTASHVPEGISAADHDEGLKASLANLARYVARAGSSGP